jgi:hypothetical protein
MNQKVPFLTRQIVYSFLVGLLVGGLTIGLLDAYGPRPMHSSAFMSASHGSMAPSCDSYSGDTAQCWRTSFFQSWWGDLWGGGGGSVEVLPDNTPTNTGSSDGNGEATCTTIDGESNCGNTDDPAQIDEDYCMRNPNVYGCR